MLKGLAESVYSCPRSGLWSAILQVKLGRRFWVHKRWQAGKFRPTSECKIPDCENRKWRIWHQKIGFGRVEWWVWKLFVPLYQGSLVLGDGWLHCAYGVRDT